MSEKRPSPTKKVLHVTKRENFDEHPDKLSEEEKRQIIAGGMYFDDPDFIAFENFPNEEGVCQPMLRWATVNDDPVSALIALRPFIADDSYSEGEGHVSLRTSQTGRADDFFQSGWMRIAGGGANYFYGEGEDVVSEILENPDRVVRFGVGNEELLVDWGTAWPKKFHDIPTREITLIERKPGALGRLAASRCIALTGYNSLISNLDLALDAIGDHITTLKA